MNVQGSKWPHTLITPSSMTLSDVLARYLRGIESSPRYEESLRRTVRKAGFYGLIDLCQLTADRANKFLAALPLGDVTRHNIRRELLTLWRYAYETGLTEHFPSRVRKITARQRAPQAWGPDQLQELLALADQDETPVSSRSPMRRCDVLPVWITVGYESGLRLTDMLQLRVEDIRNGCVSVIANKTGKTTIRKLSADTQRRVAQLCRRSPDGSVFRWTLPRRRAITMWRAFLDKNGYKGSSKWLRRSGATQLERVAPGMATRWLDHSNPALAKKHYIDATLMDLPPGPPPISTSTRGETC